MKNHPRESYSVFEKKAKEHQLASQYLFDQKAYDACVSVVCLSIINYMDALSVNLFGKDNKGKNHEQAPILLLQKLNRIGSSGFKALSYRIQKVLSLKNLAAYESRTVSRKEAAHSLTVLKEMIAYYNRNVQRTI